MLKLNAESQLKIVRMEPGQLIRTPLKMESTYVAAEEVASRDVEREVKREFG